MNQLGLERIYLNMGFKKAPKHQGEPDMLVWEHPHGYIIEMERGDLPNLKTFVALLIKAVERTKAPISVPPSS